MSTISVVRGQDIELPNEAERMTVKNLKRTRRKQPDRLTSSESLQTIIKDLQGLQQLQQFQSRLLQEVIKQVEQLDGK